MVFEEQRALELEMEEKGRVGVFWNSPSAVSTNKTWPARRTETRVASESESDVDQLLSDDLEGISHWRIRSLVLGHTGPSAAPPLLLSTLQLSRQGLTVHQ
ncbi:hypothetical protein K435DRAFT_808472 [Dendrothele bispora CBS 962.96]|uniref:Uncharacterized protein n=1 Tax=Dendrothele bispora (strain CBS 962.96) TaxID=1314807 RepID=A0A4S8L1B7_DENBC|nr:hypothetical protein K435DRAFT_808472 [Dendrothele bispora CBS 962.96]